MSDGAGERITPVQRLDEWVDQLEVAALADSAESVRPELAEVRRRAIGLRRSIAPQRDRLTSLITTSTHRFARGQCRRAPRSPERVSGLLIALGAGMVWWLRAQRLF